MALRFYVNFSAKSRATAAETPSRHRFDSSRPPSYAPSMPRHLCRVLLHHPSVVALHEETARRGVGAYLVGGAIRDRLLGLPSHDVDAVVSRDGEAISRAVADRLDARFVALGGKEFGAYRIVGGIGDAWELDVWDREGTTVEEDLARRDLTINAIALELPAGEPLDPFDGLSDLRRHLLRAVTPRSFAEDPLRVLRLPRFLGKLPGFSVEPETLGLARASAAELVTVAAERVQSELDQVFRLPETPRSMALLGALDLYPGLWLGRPGEHDDSADSRTAGRATTEIAHLGSTALALRQLAGSSRAVAIDHRLARWALTFLNLPGEGAGRAALERFGEAGYLTKKDEAALSRLLEPRTLPADDRGRRRFLHRMGSDLWSTAACLLGARQAAHGEVETWAERVRPLLTLARDHGADLFHPPRWVDGREAAEILGISPGPALGNALEGLRKAQVDGEVSDREEAVAWLRRGAG